MLKFCLYLRPFISTGILRVLYKIRYTSEHDRTNTGWFEVPDDKTVTTFHWADLETILSMALEPTFRLVALGRPGEQVGAGRIPSTNETWKDNFLALARNAQGIFILPSQRKGTKWELDQIWQSEELLGKTIFLVPPVNDEYADNHIFEDGAKENASQLADLDFRSSIKRYLSIASKLGVNHLDKLLGRNLPLIKFSADGTIPFHGIIPLSKPVIRPILFYIKQLPTYSKRIRIRRVRKTIEQAMRC